ncbi:uncharacterized protein LOC135502431 isoform X2 [Lineus longissimus]|uniref:uncharacterized protein LOC135502431 isoform X2 n=1 Tax=Lineus longissimus TaxID=88925 RepID=UPI002B4E7DB7
MSSGLFGSLRKEWDSAVNTFDKYTHSGVAVAEFFNVGNIVQLVSRNSGRAVQIVQAPMGMLTVDANGLEGPNTFNALWTVAQSYNYTVQIHNNFNYLTIENGAVVLKHYPHPNVAGPETKLRTVSVDGQFVYLECDYDEKFHIGFEKSGVLKSALATGRDVSAQFAVRLISGTPKRH